MNAYDRCIEKLDRTHGLLNEIRESNRRLRFYMDIWAIAMAALILIGAPLAFARLLGWPA